jgi:hypothetical protein
VKVPLGKTIVKVLLRPGHYSCRAEKFEPLEFDVADGGTYYVAVAIKSGFWRNTSVRLSLVSATAVVTQWNQSLKEHPPGGKVKDLTKVPEEKFKG